MLTLSPYRALQSPSLQRTGIKKITHMERFKRVENSLKLWTKISQLRKVFRSMNTSDKNVYLRYHNFISELCNLWQLSHTSLGLNLPVKLTYTNRILGPCGREPNVSVGTPQRHDIKECCPTQWHLTNCKPTRSNLLRQQILTCAYSLLVLWSGGDSM